MQQTLTPKEMDAILDVIFDNDVPPIRNYKNGYTSTHTRPSGADFGVKYDVPAQTPRELTAEECNKLFGVDVAVKMNFIPQMLISLAMEQATQLVNYCRDNKVSEVKKHTRIIKAAVEKYVIGLRAAYGAAAFNSYARYAARFQQYTSTNMMLMEMHADTLAQNQQPQQKHYLIFARTLIIVMLIDYCWNYDRQMDRLISAKLNTVVRQHTDVNQKALHQACMSLALTSATKSTPMPRWAGLSRCYPILHTTSLIRYYPRRATSDNN